MRNDRDLRLECIRLANQLATAKVIKPEEVLTKAGELYGWIEQEPISAHELNGKIADLHSKYGARR